MIRKIVLSLSAIAGWLAFASVAGAEVKCTVNGQVAPCPNPAVVGGFMVVWLVVIVILLAAMWRIFTKAGKPGWAAIIPIYNTFVQLEIIGRPLWWFILLLIPFVNIIIAIIMLNDLSRSFGKGAGFTVGLLILPFIFFPILGFGKSVYQGPSASSSSLTRM